MIRILRELKSWRFKKFPAILKKIFEANSN